jgi:hypothetical protein
MVTLRAEGRHCLRRRYFGSPEALSLRQYLLSSRSQ